MKHNPLRSDIYFLYDTNLAVDLAKKLGNLIFESDLTVRYPFNSDDIKIVEKYNDLTVGDEVRCMMTSMRVCTQSLLTEEVIGVVIAIGENAKLVETGQCFTAVVIKTCENIVIMKSDDVRKI